jgi:hypothetical protein
VELHGADSHGTSSRDIDFAVVEEKAIGGGNPETT